MESIRRRFFGTAVSLCGCVEPIRRRRLVAGGEKGKSHLLVREEVIISQGIVSLESNKQSKQVL